MKYFSFIALIGATQAMRVADLPAYRSEFYGDTWRYTNHHRLADEDQWVGDAPQAYVVMQLKTNLGVEGIQDTNYDKIEGEQWDKLKDQWSTYETTR